MAANFYTKISRAIGVSNTQVGSYAVASATQAIVLNLTLANITNAAATVSAWHNDGTSNTAIVLNAPVPVGGSLVVQKVVLQNTHSIYVASNTASTIDAIMAVMELT